MDKAVARLQGLLDLSQLQPRDFLALLLSIAFAEPRGPDGQRLRPADTSACLALRPALRLLEAAVGPLLPHL